MRDICDKIRQENKELRALLEEAEGTIRAIQNGEVDALVVNTPIGEQIFTINGAEKPYRTIIEEMSEGAIILANENTILYCNKGFAEMMNTSIEKIIGKNFLNMISTNHKSIFKDFLSFVKGEKGKISKEIMLQADDGVIVPTLISANTVIMSNIETCFLIVADLTKHMEEELKRYTKNLELEIIQRKKIEEALSCSEERFRLVAEAANVLVYELDLDTYNLTFCRGLNQLLEYEEYEISFTNDWWMNQIHPDDVNKIENRLNAAIAAGSDIVFEYRIQRKQGDYIIVHDTAKLVKNEQGRVKRIVGGVRDVTERINLQEKLKKYADNLEQLVKERTKKLKEAEMLAAIGATAGMVGHDIRNPLQGIDGAVYLAKQELVSLPANSSERETLFEILNVIEEQIHYIDHIVADLQDFAKKPIPEFEEINIENLVIESLSQVIIPKNIQVQTIFESGPGKLRLDPTFLKRVFMNLISNSLQAMPDGGELNIQVVTKQDSVEVSFKDTGVGIAEENKANIFAPLFTTKPKGQGFGLAVCKKLVNAQDGEISFESEEGKGTTFTIKIPKK